MIKFLFKATKQAKSLGLYWFTSKKQSLLQLSRELLSQHKSYKPWKNIQILHSITMSRYDSELQGFHSSASWKDQEAQIEQVIHSIIGDLHSVPHREINMLLEVLREKGFVYDKTSPIFSSLRKLMKHSFGKQFRHEELNKTLQLTKNLNFPKKTWLKLLEDYFNNPIATSTEPNSKMSTSQFMKFVILIIQQPFVPLGLVKSAINQVITHNANNLQTLTLLYHITKILPNCLKNTVEYQFAISNVRDILFNPYSLAEQELLNSESSAQKNDGNSQNSNDIDIKAEIRRKLTQLSHEITKIFFNSIDEKKLKDSIIKSFEFEQQPITKQAALFASDIVELRPILRKYISQNYEKMTPVQFLHLLKNVRDESSDDIRKKYMDRLGSYMNIQEKVYFHLYSFNNFHSKIDYNLIVDLLEQVETLNYSDFMSITKLISHLPPGSQPKIKDLLALIRSKASKV